jgi:hypothetical protein
MVNDAGSASFGDPSIVSSRDSRHFQSEMWSLCSDRRRDGPCLRSGLTDSGLPPVRIHCWAMMYWTEVRSGHHRNVRIPGVTRKNRVFKNEPWISRANFNPGTLLLMAFQPHKRAQGRRTTKISCCVRLLCLTRSAAGPAARVAIPRPPTKSTKEQCILNI